jgi:repressor LexA
VWHNWRAAGEEPVGLERSFADSGPRTGVRVKRVVARMFSERVFANRPGLGYSSLTNACSVPNRRPPGDPVNDIQLTQRQRQILDIIDLSMRERGYPPSVREIGEKVGLTSPSTVHTHLASLQRLGFLRRDPTKPRAIEVRYDPNSGAAVERRPVRHVPLVGDVAAGTDVLAQENVEELLPLPADFCGDGDLFMLRVRGDSMIDAGILDGDFVVAKAQDAAEKGDVVVAGIPGEEATVKTFNRRGGKVVLEPANPRLSPMEFDPEDVAVFGRVVTVLRRL